ncbi:LysM peptidoglycan-binding domain-containing protein [Microbacterium sp. Marseille-Q6648]|uniref:LysM peptidoglycan-binding domain-containing protein n=1 Tax=Microbacterium sp. Marseille-Q6648 TaxID=2937991 RepID=UPI00203C181F|nr:LysM peptidoglycan-binding domain-containing protein [Microbacterium sp. Marseille-Q6648]
MRRDIRRGRIPATVSAGLPAVVAGSIALALTAAPAAVAVEPAPASDRMQRGAGGVFTAPTTAPAAAPVAAASAPRTYKVRPGDTVSTIAARHGLRTQDVLSLNGLTWKSVIYPGQVLKLSGGAAAPAAAAAPKPAAPAATTHTVRAGDTISSIAARHKVSVGAVFSANGLGWSSIIYPGQKLRIPGAAAASAPQPAPAASAASGMTNAAVTTALGSHTVRAGDTIYAIAVRYKLSTAAVLAANGLSTSSIIYPGQKLVIPVASIAGLDAEQVDNARLIIQVGRELGVPDRGIAIALGTAMQESWIRNLDWGDRDSLGLFQQRPSSGWGTAAQVRDRVYSIKAFFGGPSDPNGSRTRGLLDIPGWQSMSYADAAQAVQISAYPKRYAKWEKPSYQWLAALG